MNEPHISDLPRFIQRRAFDKNPPRIVEVGPSFGSGEDWLWDRPLIEGTRLDAREVASYVEQLGMEEALATYCVPQEQIEAAVAWRKAHPKWRPPRRKSGERIEGTPSS